MPPKRKRLITLERTRTTRRFNERREVIHEYKKAKEFGVPIFLFKQENLEKQDLISEVDGETIDFSKMHYVEFGDKCDLLSKVDEALIGKKALPKTSFFEDEAKRIIASEGLEIKQTSEPLLEIVVGPFEEEKIGCLSWMRRRSGSSRLSGTRLD